MTLALRMHFATLRTCEVFFVHANSSETRHVDLRNPIAVAIPSLDGPVLQVLSATTRPLTGREVWRLAGSGSDNGVRAVLARLVRQGVVLADHRDSGTFYVANRQHLAWPAIEILASLRRTFISRLTDEIDGWPIQPLHASLFGSAARGGGDVDSDIDLLVIRPDGVDRQAWEDQLAAIGETVSAWTGNHCQLFEIDQARLREHIDASDPLVSAWLDEGVHLAARPLKELEPKGGKPS